MLFRDFHGTTGCFETIAVIEFMGNLQSTGSSSGHYRCDVKNNNLWFRTNDNSIPILIDEDEVSKQGYVILLKKKT